VRGLQLIFSCMSTSCMSTSAFPAAGHDRRRSSLGRSIGVNPLSPPSPGCAGRGSLAYHSFEGRARYTMSTCVAVWA
jgi:hypothetical protein